MEKYRVLGSKTITYHMTVEAESKLEAYDIANAAETHKWEQLEEDSTIEPLEVIQLNKDEYGMLIEL